jgi:hypothetical protein
MSPTAAVAATPSSRSARAIVVAITSGGRRSLSAQTPATRPTTMRGVYPAARSHLEAPVPQVLTNQLESAWTRPRQTGGAA